LDRVAGAGDPKEGYFKFEQGRSGPVYPRTPACYGFSVVAKVKPGREQAMRDYGRSIQGAVKSDPSVLAPLKLHYLRWLLFDVGSGLHFMYQGIFDTDLDKYIEDAIAPFNKTGITTVFVNFEGWPEDWKTNVPAVAKFFRYHQCPSFLEYGEYPNVTADEIKNALRLRKAFSEMLDQQISKKSWRSASFKGAMAKSSRRPPDPGAGLRDEIGLATESIAH
jgi:hypothetical protein